MKVGVHNTESYVWEKFNIDHLSYEYCSDGDGIVVVCEVIRPCVAAFDGKILCGFYPTHQDAMRDADGRALSTAPVNTGEIFLLAEREIIARHLNLKEALADAEQYANATYPGMLDKSLRHDRPIL